MNRERETTYSVSLSFFAVRYGFTQSKVKTMLFRMRAELKKHLEKEGYRI